MLFKHKLLSRVEMRLSTLHIDTLANSSGSQAELNPAASQPPADDLRHDDTAILCRPASMASLTQHGFHFRELLESPVTSPTRSDMASSWTSQSAQAFPPPQKRRSSSKQPMMLGPMGHVISRPRPSSRSGQPQLQQTNPTDRSPVRPATAGTANGPMPSIIGQRPAVALKIRR